MPDIATHELLSCSVSGGAGVLQVKGDSGAVDIVLDEGWAPYCQVTLRCVLPTASIVELIDPRQDQRVSFTVRQSFDPWQDGQQSTRNMVVRTFDLALTNRRVNHTAGELVLTCASDEATAQDWKRMTASILRPAYTSARTAIAFALQQIGATLQAGTADGTIVPDSSAWPPGLSAWDYMLPLAQACDLRIYCDEQRRWFLVPAGDLAGGMLALSYLDDIVDVSDELDRAAGLWFDGVVITYQWTDTNNVQQLAYDVAPTTGTVRRALAITRSTAKPGAGAAASILRRSKGRALSMATRAVSDWLATPTQPVQITAPNGTPIRYGAVASVHWVMPEDQMDITTRELVDTVPNSWAAIPAGRRWSDIAAGVPWSGAWNT